MNIVNLLMAVIALVVMMVLVMPTANSMVNDILSQNVTTNVTSMVNGVLTVSEIAKPFKDANPAAGALSSAFPIVAAAIILIVTMRLFGLFTGDGRARFVERVRLMGDHSGSRNSRSTRYYFEDQAANLDSQLKGKSDEHSTGS